MGTEKVLLQILDELRSHGQILRSHGEILKSHGKELKDLREGQDGLRKGMQEQDVKLTKLAMHVEHDIRSSSVGRTLAF